MEFVYGFLIFVGLLGLLVLQWLHKIGFKVSKVQQNEMPSFFMRITIQILGILLGLLIMLIISKLTVNSIVTGDFSNPTWGVLNAYSNLILKMMSSTSSLGGVLFMNGIIVSIQYWILLSISSLMLARNISFNKHLIAALIPSTIYLILLSIIPMIMMSNYMNVSGI